MWQGHMLLREDRPIAFPLFILMMEQLVAHIFVNTAAIIGKDAPLPSTMDFIREEIPLKYIMMMTCLDLPYFLSTNIQHFKMLKYLSAEI